MKFICKVRDNQKSSKIFLSTIEEYFEKKNFFEKIKKKFF